MGASGDGDHHPVPDHAALAALLHTLNERPEPTMRPPATFWITCAWFILIGAIWLKLFLTTS